MDLWKTEPNNLAYKAKSEKYAKIISKTIITAGTENSSFGDNSFFYDAAEGLLTSTILLVAEFCPPETRHIVSVFKVIQDLLAPSKVKGKSQFQLLINQLPEEDRTKHFMVSLIVQQLYREILAVADEHGGKLPNRVMMFLDEFGSIPRISDAEVMFSASRSRRCSIVAIIQSFAQLTKNYGKEGEEIIVDNTQLTIFGGFAPNSESAERLSKSLGTRTVLSGSVSRGKNDPSQSLQMIERALMTPDELKSLPKGTFVVTKTGAYPMQVRLKLFFDWGIEFPSELYDVPDKGNRIVAYARKEQLQTQIIEVYPIQADESIAHSVPNDRHLRKPNTIAHDNKCSVSTVKRAIDELIRKGYVKKDARWRDNGGRTSNGYVCGLLLHNHTPEKIMSELQVFYYVKFSASCSSPFDTPTEAYPLCG